MDSAFVIGGRRRQSLTQIPMIAMTHFPKPPKRLSTPRFSHERIGERGGVSPPVIAVSTETGGLTPPRSPGHHFFTASKRQRNDVDMPCYA